MRFDALRIGRGEPRDRSALVRLGQGHQRGLGPVVLGEPTWTWSRRPVDATGEAIRREVVRQGIAGHWVATDTPDPRLHDDLWTASQTRSLSWSKTHRQRRLAELAAFRERVRDRRCKLPNLVVLTGSLPAGSTGDLLSRSVARHPLPCDSRHPRTGTLGSAWSVVRCWSNPIGEELGHSVGRPIESDEDLAAGVAQLHARGAEWVGDFRRTTAVAGERTGRAPSSDAAQREAGQPDRSGRLSDGWHWPWVSSGGLPLREALRLGVAAAAENVTQLLPARLDLAAVRRQAGLIGCEDV